MKSAVCGLTRQRARHRGQKSASSRIASPACNRHVSALEILESDQAERTQRFHPKSQSPNFNLPISSAQSDHELSPRCSRDASTKHLLISLIFLKAVELSDRYENLADLASELIRLVIRWLVSILRGVFLLVYDFTVLGNRPDPQLGKPSFFYPNTICVSEESG